MQLLRLPVHHRMALGCPLAWIARRRCSAHTRPAAEFGDACLTCMRASPTRAGTMASAGSPGIGKTPAAASCAMRWLAGEKELSTREAVPSLERCEQADLSLQPAALDGAQTTWATVRDYSVRTFSRDFTGRCRGAVAHPGACAARNPRSRLLARARAAQ